MSNRLPNDILDHNPRGVNSQLNRRKPSFPWIRLLVGLYFSVAGITALLRVTLMERVTNPYIKPEAILTVITGTILLGSGLWVVIERNQIVIVPNDSLNDSQDDAGRNDPNKLT